MTTKNWKFKVVKSQRGMGGEWFRHRAAATFASEAEACRYAETFAAEQKAAGVVGTRINVLSRRKLVGEFGPTHCVAEYLV